MNTKLTLTIEEEIIQKARLYAKQKNRSLSNLVENYLRSLTREDDIQQNKSSPIVKSLRGSFKASVDLDYKAELSRALEKRHL